MVSSECSACTNTNLKSTNATIKCANTNSKWDGDGEQRVRRLLVHLVDAAEELAQLPVGVCVLLARLDLRGAQAGVQLQLLLRDEALAQPADLEARRAGALDPLVRVAAAREPV